MKAKGKKIDSNGLSITETSCILWPSLREYVLISQGVSEQLEILPRKLVLGVLSLILFLHLPNHLSPSHQIKDRG